MRAGNGKHERAGWPPSLGDRISLEFRKKDVAVVVPEVKLLPEVTVHPNVAGQKKKKKKKKKKKNGVEGWSLRDKETHCLSNGNGWTR
jgi:ABC-type lipoprotein export system ATPase subunit